MEEKHEIFLPQLSEKSKQVQTMFDKISARYDFLNRLLSFGQDTRWRKAILKKLPLLKNKEGTLYDVACGTGDVLFSVLKTRQDYIKFIGFDISSGMLDQAKKNLKEKRKADTEKRAVSFVQASAEALPVANDSADALTISFGFRNVDDRNQALKEFYRVLKNGGSLFILEFFTPQQSLLSKCFDFYFKKILPFVGGLFSDKKAYQYLPNSVSTMPHVDEFTKMLKEAGFSGIEKSCWLAGSTVLFQAKKG